MNRTRVERWILVLVLAAPVEWAQADRDAWPMFRGNAELTGVAGSDLPANPEVAWTFRREDGFSATAAIVGQAVFAPCEDGKLYALRQTTGELVWTYDAGAPIHASPLSRGLLFFGDDDGVFHAVDKETGAGRWKFKTGGEIISSANVFGRHVIFGSYDGALYCLNMPDGALVWKAQTEDRLHGSCSIAGETVMIGGCDGVLHVFNLADGAELRRVPLDAVTGSSAAVVGERAFIGTYGNEVLGIDHGAGKVLWRFTNDDREFPYFASPAVGKGLVVIGGRDKRLHGLDAATGAQKWEVATKGRIDSSAVVVGDRAFFGSSDGNLYAVALATGEQVWRFEAAEPITASPAVGNGRMVIGTADGTLYCFGGAKADK